MMLYDVLCVREGSPTKNAKISKETNLLSLDLGL
eukprot:UN14812